MDEKALGKHLQLARRRAGLTQQELCHKAGLSYSTLAKIERGAIRSPSVFTVAAIASATNTPLEELLELEARGLKSPAPSDTKKRSKTGVRFVYFDVNGTLIRYDERAYTKISSETHTPIEIIETMFLQYDGAACRGSMANAEVDKILANEFGLPDFSWEKYYLEYVETTPQSHELIHWTAQHFEVGLLSNNWLGFTDKLIEKGFIPSIKYAAAVESAKVGCAKPEAKIYQIAQELAAAQPDEILMVDDKLAYLAGAEQAGWQTVLFEEDDPEHSIERVKKYLEF